ncbi:MAG: hypothetical protein WAK96_02035, partial [Desulfobaccales bacterium]
ITDWRVIKKLSVGATRWVALQLSAISYQLEQKTQSEKIKDFKNKKKLVHQKASPKIRMILVPKLLP